MINPSRKRLIVRIAGLVLVLAVVIVAGVADSRFNPQKEVIVAQPQIVQIQGSPIISATGEVRPAEWTTLSFDQPGRVIDLEVEIGDTVEAGEVIARLDTTDLELQLTQIEFSLLAAEARLDQMEAGPRDEEVEAMKQTVAAANARIAAAVARRDQLYSSISEADIIDAENNLRQAQKNLEDLQQSMNDLINWADNTDLSDFEPGDFNPLSAGESLAWQIELAELELDAAQAYYDDLIDGPDENSVKVANAQIWLASAQAKAAQARLDLMLAGATKEALDVARAQIEEAAADVALAKARLEQAEIIAPFNGTITDLYIDTNAYVAPGQDIVQIADLSTLRVETTDLNEIDVARVNVGDNVTITFDALSDSVQGTVVRIAPKSSPGAGVNFTVLVDMEDLPEALRWGMTAFVDIQVQ